MRARQNSNWDSFWQRDKHSICSWRFVPVQPSTRAQSKSSTACALNTRKTNPCAKSSALRKKDVPKHRACRKRTSGSRSWKLSGQVFGPSAIGVQLESSWSSQLQFPIPMRKAAPGHRNAPTVEVFEGIWSYKRYILYFLRVETSVVAII